MNDFDDVPSYHHRRTTWPWNFSLAVGDIFVYLATLEMARRVYQEEEGRTEDATTTGQRQLLFFLGTGLVGVAGLIWATANAARDTASARRHPTSRKQRANLRHSLEHSATAPMIAAPLSNGHQRYFDIAPFNNFSPKEENATIVLHTACTAIYSMDLPLRLQLPFSRLTVGKF